MSWSYNWNPQPYDHDESNALTSLVWRNYSILNPKLVLAYAEDILSF